MGKGASESWTAYKGRDMVVGYFGTFPLLFTPPPVPLAFFLKKYSHVPFPQCFVLHSLSNLHWCFNCQSLTYCLASQSFHFALWPLPPPRKSIQGIILSIWYLILPLLLPSLPERGSGKREYEETSWEALRIGWVRDEGNLNFSYKVKVERSGWIQQTSKPSTNSI